LREIIKEYRRASLGNKYFFAAASTYLKDRYILPAALQWIEARRCLQASKRTVEHGQMMFESSTKNTTYIHYNRGPGYFLFD
jgi:hypothetical protein